MRCVAVVVACAGAAAHADDRAIANWTGPYIGANLGGGWGATGFDYAPNDGQAVNLFGAGGKPPAASFDLSGVLGGVQIGYNRQLGSQWLIGIEADIEASGLKGAGASSGVFAPYYLAPFNAPMQQRIDWFGTIRARMGYLPTSTLLVYGTAGFAYGRVSQHGSWDTETLFGFGGGAYGVNCPGGNRSCFAGSSRHFGMGWTAGGGIEYALVPNWVVRAEYLHLSIDGGSMTETNLVSFPPELPSSFNAASRRVEVDIVRVGLSHRFR